MPELPDIVVYLEALERRVMGTTVQGFRVSSPSVMRTWDPPHDSAVGRVVTGLHRVGKRIVFELGETDASEDRTGPLFIVIHLMIAGRLRS